MRMDEVKPGIRGTSQFLHIVRFTVGSLQEGGSVTGKTSGRLLGNVQSNYSLFGDFLHGSSHGAGERFEIGLSLRRRRRGARFRRFRFAWLLLCVVVIFRGSLCRLLAASRQEDRSLVEKIEALIDIPEEISNLSRKLSRKVSRMDAIPACNGSWVWLCIALVLCTLGHGG
jgi:hypothetical protein